MKTMKFLLLAVLIGSLGCNAQLPMGEEKQPEEQQAEKGAPGEVPAADKKLTTGKVVPGEPSELAGKIVPAGVDWFGAVNLQALKGTVLERQFKPWIRYAEALPDYKKAEELGGAGELMGHAVVLGGSLGSQMPTSFDGFVAIFGLKDEKLLGELAAVKMAEKAPPPEFVGWKSGYKQGLAVWMGSPEFLDDVADLAEGKGKSVNTDEGLAELQRGINTKAPLWAVSRIPEWTKEQIPIVHSIMPGLQYFPGFVEVLGATHAAFSVDLGDRLEVRFALKLKSPEDAQVVVEQLALATEATLWEPALFFETFDFVAQGPLVTFAAATTPKAWRVAVFWMSIGAQAVAYDEWRQW